MSIVIEKVTIQEGNEVKEHSTSFLLAQSELQADIASMIGSVERSDGKAAIIAAPVNLFGKTSLMDTLRVISTLISTQSMKKSFAKAKKELQELLDLGDAFVPRALGDVHLNSLILG